MLKERYKMKINLSHNIQHSHENTTEENLNLTTLTLSLYKDSNRFFLKSENDFFPSYNHDCTYETFSNNFSRNNECMYMPIDG